MVFTFAFEVPVFASEGAFRSVVAEDLVLIGGELFAPLFGGFFDGVLFVGHLVCLTLGAGGLLAAEIFVRGGGDPLADRRGLGLGPNKKFL